MTAHRCSWPGRRLGRATRSGLLALAVFATCAQPLRAATEAPPQVTPASAAQAQALEEIRSLRQQWRDLAYRDLKSELAQLRSTYETARRRGDRHAEWIHLAWLANHTAAYDLQSAVPLLDQAERAIGDARAAADPLATFELVLMTESTSVLQFSRAPRPARLDLLQQLAGEIGGPLHEGLVRKLRGIIASQSGQEGEALYQFQRALPLLTGQIERAELLVYMALALFDNPTRSAANLAAAYLDEVVRTLPPEKYPGLLTPAIRLSQLLGRLDRQVEALELAQRALNAAQRAGLATPLARAYVARGQAYLAAGEYGAALADFNAVTFEALNNAYKLDALSGRALALARLGDTGARSVLEEGRALAQSLEGGNKAGLAAYYEASARAWQVLNEPGKALEDLAHAASIRLATASAAQERLTQARVDAAEHEARATAEAPRRTALAVGAALLGVALLTIAALYVGQRRRRRLIASLADSLGAANAQLRQLSDARSRQLAAACRELRQPAHALSHLAEPGVGPLSEPQARQRYMEAVRQSSRTLTDMLDALMDMTRLQEGTYVPHAERFELGDLLDEVDRQFRPLAEQKGLAWAVHPSQFGVFSDRHLLRRIVVNLVGHVVKHASRGSVQVHVMPSEQNTCIEIVASEETRPEAAADADPDELGLGLATASQACQMLGHELSVQRSPSLGVLYRLSLPRAFVPSAAEMRDDALTVDRTVAIVEDDAFGRITLMNALLDAGMDAQGFASIEELVAPASRFSHGVPGVLVTDLNLGEKGPVTEALRQLRRRPEWRDVPVLLLTGDVREEVGAIAEELGVALAYKPISVRRLRERLALLRSPQPLPPAPPAFVAAGG